MSTVWIKQLLGQPAPEQTQLPVLQTLQFKTYTSSLSSRFTDSCNSWLISSSSSFKNLFCEVYASRASPTLSPVLSVWTGTERFPMPPVLQSSSRFVSSTIAPSFALWKYSIISKIINRKCCYSLCQNVSHCNTFLLSHVIETAGTHLAATIHFQCTVSKSIWGNISKKNSTL